MFFFVTGLDTLKKKPSLYMAPRRKGTKSGGRRQGRRKTGSPKRRRKTGSPKRRSSSPKASRRGRLCDNKNKNLLRPQRSLRLYETQDAPTSEEWWKNHKNNLLWYETFGEIPQNKRLSFFGLPNNRHHQTCFSPKSTDNRIREHV